MIKAIIFDAGGVLFNSKKSLFDTPIEYLVRVTNQPKDIVDKAYREVIKDCEYKEVGQKELWERIMTKLDTQIPFDGQNPIAEGFKVFRRDEELFPIIRKLKANYKLAIVSNANAVEAATPQAAGIYREFDTVILSYKVGVRKPDPKIYQIAINQLQLAPEEIIFVDNNQENFGEANKLGLKGILFKNTEQFKDELKHLGVKIDV